MKIKFQVPDSQATITVEAPYSECKNLVRFVQVTSFIHPLDPTSQGVKNALDFLSSVK